MRGIGCQPKMGEKKRACSIRPCVGFGYFANSDGLVFVLLVLVEDFNQFLGFFRVFAAQDFGGIVFEMAGVAVQDDVFNRKQVVGVHGEAAQAYAEVTVGKTVSPAISPQMDTPFPCGLLCG